MIVKGIFQGRELSVELVEDNTRPGMLVGRCWGMRVSRVTAEPDLFTATVYCGDVAVYADGVNFQEALNNLAVKLDSVRQWARDAIDREKST